MFVLEKYRGQGIGTRLFNAFFSWAKKKGAKRKLVMAYAPNSEAISFYKKQGFSDYALTMEGNL
jgi:GNAT superfamily N-acetyltransferase